MVTMNVQLEVHATQAEIIRHLLFSPEARFSELNTGGLSSDKFSFHLRRLTNLGLLTKRDDKYSLTTLGKEFANRLDTDEGIIERQAKLTVMLVPVRDEPDGERQYLVQRRLKQPYFGYWGFLSGKVRWGETVLAAAARELREETGLAGELTYLGTQHKLDYSHESKLLEDKYFFVVLADKLGGELMERIEGGENEWQTAQQILAQERLFQGMDMSLRLARGDLAQFTETVFRYDEQDY